MIYAVGAADDRRLGIPGEDLPEVLEALDFIEQAIEGLRRFHFGQEKFDAFEVALEICGEFDYRLFCHKQAPSQLTRCDGV